MHVFPAPQGQHLFRTLCQYTKEILFKRKTYYYDCSALLRENVGPSQEGIIDSRLDARERGKEGVSEYKLGVQIQVLPCV